MGKKSAGGKSAQKSGKTSSDTGPTPSTKCPVSVTKDGHFTISIHVKPGAKANTITDITEDAVGVQIAAPPVDGEANSEIIRYFADILGVRKGDVSLKGGKSREKTVTIDASCGLSLDSILDKLKNDRKL